MECNKSLQNVTECGCLIHEILWNAEAEAIECYEMIYKLIQANPFGDTLFHSFYYVSTFRHNVVIDINI